MSGRLAAVGERLGVRGGARFGVAGGSRRPFLDKGAMTLGRIAIAPQPVFAHDLRANAFRVCREGKPLHTPHQVRGRLFRIMR